MKKIIVYCSRFILLVAIALTEYYGLPMLIGDIRPYRVSELLELSCTFDNGMEPKFSIKLHNRSQHGLAVNTSEVRFDGKFVFMDNYGNECEAMDKESFGRMISGVEFKRQEIQAGHDLCWTVPVKELLFIKGSGKVHFSYFKTKLPKLTLNPIFGGYSEGAFAVEAKYQTLPQDFEIDTDHNR